MSRTFQRAAGTIGNLATRLGAQLAEMALNAREGAQAIGAMAAKYVALTAVALHALPSIIDLLGIIQLLPAAILAGGLAMATLKLATNGVGDAIKEALTDWNKWEKTTKDLPRSVHDFVAAVVLIRNAFVPLRKELAHRLFGGLGADLVRLNTAHFPALNRWMPRIADSFREAGHSLLVWLADAERVAQIEAIFRNLTAFIGSMNRVLKPMAEIFLDIAEVAAPRLASIADTFANLMDRAAEWIGKMKDSGALGEWLDKAVSGFTELRGIAADLVGVIAAVYSSADTGGQTFLETLHAQTTALREWAESAAGERAFEGLSQLGEIILKLGVIVAQSFIGIVYVVGAIYRAFNGFLSFVLNVLSSILHAAAVAFQWIPGIGPKLQQASKEFDAYRDRVNKSLAGIKDETVMVNIITVERKAQGGTLGGSGGFRGFATGGIATGLIKVGERGAELIDVGARGARVRNAGDTRRAVSGGGSAGGGGTASTPSNAAGNSAGLLAAAMNTQFRYMLNSVKLVADPVTGRVRVA